MCIPCDKTFHMVPLFLTSWPWPWSLTYFWKILTLAITFLPGDIGLSYCTCVFLVTTPFTGAIIFDLVTLTLKFDLLLKNFNHGFLFTDGCYPASVVVFWQLLLYELVSMSGTSFGNTFSVGLELAVAVSYHCQFLWGTLLCFLISIGTWIPITILKKPLWFYERSRCGEVVKFLACGARGLGFNSGSRRYNFRDWLYPASKSWYGWQITKAM